MQNKPDAPQDLREHALIIAGNIIDFSPDIKAGAGYHTAKKILEDGSAWKKLQAICQAQGGLREPPTALYTHPVTATYRGRITAIDNRQLSRLAKLAGAPRDKAAGVTLHTPLQTLIEKEQPLFTIHAESKGELRYALSLLEQIPEIIQVEACE